MAPASALFGTHRDLRQANEAVADLLVKQLQVQLFRIESNIDARARFPDRARSSTEPSRADCDDQSPLPA